MKSVAPGDLLTVGNRPAVVRDGHLERTDATLQDPRGGLRVEPEASLPQVKAEEQIEGHHLQARVHVAQVAVEQQVGGERESAIADRLRIGLIRRVHAEDARAEDNVATAGGDRREHAWQIGGRVLVIRVERDDVRAASLQSSGHRGGALTDGPGVVMDHQPMVVYSLETPGGGTRSSA